MTAKSAVVFGALYLLDGRLLRSWGDALVLPLIGILLWVPFGIGVVWYPGKDQRVELTARELRVRRERLPMEKVNPPHVARLWMRGGPRRTTSRCGNGPGSTGWSGSPCGTAGRSAWSCATRPPSPRCSVPSRSMRAAAPTSSARGPQRRPAPEPRPVRARPVADAGSGLDLLDIFN
ncbi:hypothetical protein [Streptomyces sp. M92]|uniref:hypothetical protein n=1 Tax=Streptomyces sp. M92 TaxID=2944250 RepID=UPI00234B1CB3|nr:hypothetical protein [Streptomyces sp. M92]WCN05418.1 hypothetical protein M6G08_26905 [Streptomyces sp. M92]